MWLPCGWANRDVDAVTDATGHDGFVCCIRFYHGGRAAQPLSAAVLSLLRPARAHGVFFDNTLLSTLIAHALSHPVKGSWTHGCAAQDGGGQQSAFDTAISQPCHAWSAHTGGDCSLARTSCTHLVTPAWVPFKGAGALTGAGSAGLVASLTPFPEKPHPLFPALRYIMLVLTASLLRLYSGCLGVNIAQHLKA